MTALTRIELGNFSNVKSVGGGVHESRIDFGPGYRIYLGQDGETLVILLGGGTKKRQQDDIQTAKARWEDYEEKGGIDDASDTRFQRNDSCPRAA